MSVSHAPGNAAPLDALQTSRLATALDGLSRDQLLWASGFAAGLAQAQAPQLAAVATPAAEPGGQAALTVLYGSQTGNGEAVARRLAADAEARGFAVRLDSLSDYKPSAIRHERVVTFVVSTHGEGDPPDDAELFHEFLMSDSAPRLRELDYAVLALGDSSYVNFCQTGREFDQRLGALGASRLLPIVECDLDYDSAAAAWRDSVLEALPSVVDAAAPKLHAVPTAPHYDRQQPFMAEVLVNQKITGGNSTKDVRHIELSLEGSGIRYEPGDALAVIAENPPALVSELLEVLQLDSDIAVTVGDATIPFGDALRTRLEITVSTAAFVKAWASIAGSDELDAVIAAPDALAGFLADHQVVDVVRRYPAQTDAQTFVDSLRALTPRSYSIASSQQANVDEVHLTVAVVRYEAFGREHWGAASTHLAERLAPGDRVPVYVEPNSRFRLPPDDATDIIMIGPGTGVAPFRAFVEERAARRASGRSWLFFGDRSFSADFLYQLEWQRHLKRGALERLDVAFSRDQADKVYVQHRIRQRGADVHRWLEGGAHVYVCGDAKRMAGDVDDALIDVIATHGNLGRDEAMAHLKRLRRDGRYQRDVY